jgi:hypothetical protein
MPLSDLLVAFGLGRLYPVFQVFRRVEKLIRRSL